MKSEAIFGGVIIILLTLLVVVSSNPVFYLAGPVESNGAIPVNIQDQTTDIIDMHLIVEEGNFTLASPAIKDSLTLTLNAGHGVTVGEMVELYENNTFYQGEVLGVATNTISLDTPLDSNFSISALGIQGDSNLNKDGSNTTIIGRVSPKYLINQSFDITRILLIMEDNSNPDTQKFGGIAGGITKGVVLRSHDGNDKNIFNAKTNGDFASHSYDIDYDDRAGGSGVYAVRVRSSFAGPSKRGVTIRLNSEDLDEIQILIQDDLTPLTTFHVIAQGHIVTE